jgi:hypothetical protein
LAIAAASLATLASTTVVSAATSTTTAADASATPALHHCPPQALEVDYAGSAPGCDSNHGSHRDPINRCGVLEIDTGGNWVATWAGPDMDHLGYYAMGPSTVFRLGSSFCVGDIAINP